MTSPTANNRKCHLGNIAMILRQDPLIPALVSVIEIFWGSIMFNREMVSFCRKMFWQHTLVPLKKYSVLVICSGTTLIPYNGDVSGSTFFFSRCCCYVRRYFFRWHALVLLVIVHSHMSYVLNSYLLTYLL